MAESKLDVNVSLYTWFTLSENSFLAKFSIFKKRVKRISNEVQVHNFPVFEAILVIYLRFLALLKVDKGHTPRYQMQLLFGYLLLPVIYLKRKNSILVLSETAAWPITYYAKKWGIAVVMDFPSISHEEAAKAGIAETAYGIKIKALERQCIDYALNCSTFAANTYRHLTSAKKHFPLWLAAEAKQTHSSTLQKTFKGFNICCIANTEQRKGVDLLLKAFHLIDSSPKKLFLIGKIDRNWVKTFCGEQDIDSADIIIPGAFAQQDLTAYLIANHIQLHILPSRFDSFGMVVPETMMLGIPNVVSPNVGAGELLKHGYNGFIMEELNETSILKEINNYLNLTILEKNNLRINVLEQAKMMTWEKYSGRVVSVFKEILEEVNL